ncbi:MAG: hypothetical protein ACE3L7_14585 [Candidatus Pristimantibacillus sp.]
MHPVEQMDIFAYLEEKELEESVIRANQAAKASETTPSTASTIITPDTDKLRLGHLTRFTAAIQWRLDNLITIFGLLQWVNVYTIRRALGGSEAGGWYYRRFTCEESHLVWRWKAKDIQQKLFQVSSCLIWGHITSDSVGQEVVVLIEQRKAAQQYAAKPSYHPDRVIGKGSVSTSSTATRTGRDKSIPFVLISGNLPNRSRIQTTVVEEDCDRCGGTGQTSFFHIQNGVCFKCKGKRVLTRRSS